MSPSLSSVLAQVLAVLPLLQVQATVYNGLASTPQMGWDNWNAFGCDVSEDLLLGTAQKIVDYGLRDLGYHYVILDDCWSAGRTADGTLQPNATKFPNGMAYVGDQLHSLGLGWGMYSSAGLFTCAQYAASLGREKQDAATFASWGVDYLKYDNCFNAGQSGTALNSYNRYNAMSVALNETGRPILYSLCNWGEDGPWNWGPTISNSWRMSGDVYDSFDRPDSRCPCSGDEYECPLPGYHCSVMNILNKMSAVSQKSLSGGWNDMDMLEVGNGGMTDDEYKVHMSMWALMKSPLIIGTDVRTMTPATLSIYSNPAVIAVNQDPLASSGLRVWRYYVDDTDSYGQGEISLWATQLSGGDYAVALVNAGNNSRVMNATMTELFTSLGEQSELTQSFDVYDLWANRMTDAEASSILNGNATVNGTIMDVNGTTTQYNATEMSYADGLANDETALLGMKTGSVAPMGTLTASVPRHGVGLFRLRPQGGSSMRKRDEL